MLDSFFGIHPYVVRSGLWVKMRPGEKDLYVYLMEESERLCTRQISATDAEVTNKVGVASRTLCDARKKLQERGLALYARHGGQKYSYTICNPRTGQPYAGDPRTPLVVPKRSPKNQDQRPAQITSSAAPKTLEPTFSQPLEKSDELPLESYGMPGVFPKSR